MVKFNKRNDEAYQMVKDDIQDLIKTTEATKETREVSNG
jgi:hypothetical protein